MFEGVVVSVFYKNRQNDEVGVSYKAHGVGHVGCNGRSRKFHQLSHRDVHTMLYIYTTHTHTRTIQSKVTYSIFF